MLPSPSLQAAHGQPVVESRHALEALLRLRQVSMHFQPIVSSNGREVFAYEALARGNAAGPLASPLTMFSAAREQGRLVELDSLCRERALEQWSTLGLTERLFINVSPDVLLDGTHSPGLTRRLLRRFGLRPHQVVIELTEQTPGLDSTLMREAVSHYQSMGFAIALDDLGEGYASLKLWSSVQPDFVKIDRHFISGIHADPLKRRFVRSIIDIAHGSGSQVIAEGIEHEAEMECVRQLGADYLQGWLFAPAEADPLGQRAALDRHLRHLSRMLQQRSPPGRSIGSLARAVTPVQQDVTVNEVAQRLHAEQEVMSLAVVDEQQRPVGLIIRHRLLGLLSQRFGPELHARRLIHEVMQSSPLRVEADETLEGVSAKVTGREGSDRDEDFIITRGGRYQGLGRTLDLLRIITELQVASAEEANPLTRLPGNGPIERQLLECVAGEGGGMGEGLGEDLRENSNARSAEWAAIYLDLDHFKPFNDRFGHAQGDRMLLALATVLRDALQEGDFLGHVGGDDFVMTLCMSEPRRALRLTALEQRLAGLQSAFQHAVASLYPADVLAAGGFQGHDRFDTTRFFPLTRLSLVALHGLAGCETTRIAARWSELKSEAKARDSGRVIEACASPVR